MVITANISLNGMAERLNVRGVEPRCYFLLPLYREKLYKQKRVWKIIILEVVVHFSR